MLEVYPLPIRKVTGLRTNNAILARKCELFDQIAYYSDVNDEKLFRFASLLKRSRSNFTLETENIFNNTKKISLDGPAAASCFVLWNLAALLSQSISILTTRDTHTMSEISRRLKRIIQIFYYLKTEGIPSMTPNRVTDMTVQLCTFYHCVYSAHLYEFLLLTEATPENYMCAVMFFEAADGFNPTGKKQFVEKVNWLRLLAIESHAKREESLQNYGSSIAFLQQAMKLFDSCPRSQRKQRSDWIANLKTKLAAEQKDNTELYHEAIAIATPLPSGDNVQPEITQTLDFTIDSPADTQELDAIVERVTQTEQTLKRCADSFAMLVTLVCECNSARKLANEKLFTDKNPTEARLAFLKSVEIEVENLFEWIGVTQSTSLAIFELDANLEKLNGIRERLKEEIIPFMSEIDRDEANLMLDSLKEELLTLVLPPSFESDMATKIAQCLTLTEKLMSYV